MGGFHRAHMARYTHDLLALGNGEGDWGIVGVGLMPSDSAIVDSMRAQDCLYSLVERDESGEHIEIIGAIITALDYRDGAAAVLDAIAGAQIVSLTITENGYYLRGADKRLNLEHPAIAADLSDAGAPKTAIGILAEAFERRRQSGAKAFTALSCDNIQHNGAVLRRAVLDFAEAREPALARWIESEARFPSCMVDRITPSPTKAQSDELAARTGIADQCAVFCEDFRQWVIEDDFADGRPDWEYVGAQFVRDVTPYERMKLRLLNASHLAIAGIGRLMNYAFVNEAMSDTRLQLYMAALMDKETGPTLPADLEIDLPRYKRTLIARFANPAIRDTLDRINADAPVNYLLDPLRDRLAAGEGITLLALALAAWIRRVRGVDESGQPLEVRHPLAEDLRRAAEIGGGDPRPVLAITSLFGDLGGRQDLVAPVQKWLEHLYAHGANSALDRACAEVG